MKSTVISLELKIDGMERKGGRCNSQVSILYTLFNRNITNNHTTATVTHWTGRQVAKASTTEWPIRQFLYNLTDQAALKVVGQIISQRCLETGVSEVYLEVSEEDKTKEKMVKFIDVIEQSGLSLSEPEVYQPVNPHIANHRRIQYKKVKPWTVLEPEN